MSPYVELGITNIWNREIIPEDLYFDYDALDEYDLEGNTSYVNHIDELAPYDGPKNWDVNPLLGAGLSYTISSGKIVTLS